MEGAAIVGVPMYTLSRYAGVAKSPAALRKAGIARAFGLDAIDHGDVTLGRIRRDTGPDDLRNFGFFRRGTGGVCEKVAGIREAKLLVVLGGECSLVVGEVAGLRSARKGRAGMVWMDAHGDFNVPETTPSGYIGGMCLAFACGRGPSLSRRIDDLMPLIGEGSVLHLGARALDEAEGAAIEESQMKLITATEIRKIGAVEASRRVARWVEDAADWVVCHFDVDVVDPSVIPSVNYPTRGGLTSDEAKALLRSIARTGKLAALNFAAYNASLDPDGNSALTVVEIASGAFGQ